MNATIVPKHIRTVINGKKRWTYDDFHLLPPEFPCQIINGELTMSPAPNLNHQIISREIGILIYNFITGNSKFAGSEILYAPVDVVLGKDNILQPDLIYISSKNKNILTEKNIQGAPDMVIEVLSPSTIKQDRVEKMELYAGFGIKEFWIIDPVNRSVEVYKWVRGGYKLISFAAEKGKVFSKVIHGFNFEIKKVFSKIEY